ncbi:MCE family protein [Mycobacterium intermedium]|uniref:MCE family protein n=1 Tax=Mycobacterium intermedium TaxID=28445 RepID=A0A1E3SEX9_MYCIE|nr:MlaD family protein [Mycobacterium intermedium]MCV6963096.1 MCE family protein [Mycobacterium intermedium]ODR00691.1 mammalian cell entry protein [Mycobacterium intermedium]OPE52310.1 MCE family protein [Mycobacterium intermedium]ORB03637.1 MCE family protein [Mycobacterium intermedium]
MLHLPRRVRLQLAVFTVIAVGVLAVTFLHFVKLPAMLFGVGRYTVTVELPESGGLYDTSNVTYRGFEVGRVDSVRLSQTGVEAVLSLKSGIDIPSDLKAEVHSQTAIGETYIELLPRNATSPPLKDGDKIRVADTSVPPDINELLSAANTALEAIPHDNLQTVVDESYTAVGGLGPELSRLITGTSTLAIDARKNLDPLVSLIDHAPAVLDTQNHSSDAITAWAAQLAAVTRELQTHDDAVAGVIVNGPPALAETTQLVERLQPTLPVLLANLVSVGQVALTYQNDIEQILVVFPMAVAADQAGVVANLNTKQPYRGQYLSFNLNLNLPPPCTTGFLPAQQQRGATFEDSPARPPGDLYCRVPQDSMLNVRGARNIPCETVPGKRAPTVKLCESSENFVPLNDGFTWKGDPNATLSGQDVPQLPPGSPPPIAAAPYDPATGTYVGPDGQRYTRADLAQAAPKDKTWQTMLLPPGS